MTTLIELAVKTSALAVMAALITGLMRHASAASRHLVWTGMFVVALIVPVARMAVPPIPLFVLAPEPPRPSESSSLAAASEGRRPFTNRWENSARAEFPNRMSQRSVDGGTRPVQPIEPATPVMTSLAPAVADPVADDAASTRRPSWRRADWLMGIWLIGVLALGCRAAVGAVAIRRLARRMSVATDADVLSRFQHVVEHRRLRRRVRLLIGDAATMPVTWGVIRPRLLLPSSARAWVHECPDRLDAVLTHEVAHILRLDVLSQGIGRIAVALFWFNPLFWFAARQARLERERACDDAVLASGMRATNYARDLVALVESSSMISAASVGALAMARRSQIERRIDSILDSRVNRGGVSRATGAIAGVLLIAMAPISVVRLAARPATSDTKALSGDDITLPIARPSIQDKSPAISVHRTAAVTEQQPTPPPVVASVQEQRRTDLVTILQLADAAAQAAATAQTPADEKWRADRAEMFNAVLARARQHLDDAKLKIKIGTLASIELKDFEVAVSNIEVIVARERDQSRQLVAPPEADIAAVKARFAYALAGLDDAETRSDLGIVSVAVVNEWTMATLAVLTNPSSATDGGVGWDEVLLAALRAAARIPSDTRCADTLVALAKSNALTPEMVALYVAAAKLIQSPTERARVFAQPIRVK